jgi:DNA-binding PadR family transcriptional regulator
MALPTISPLQCLVLDILSRRSHDLTPGPELRELLDKEGAPRSGPAFYQCMSRLEAAGLVRGTYASLEINGQKIRERRYTITREGAKALEEFRAFSALIVARSGPISGLGFQGG